MTHRTYLSLARAQCTYDLWHHEQRVFYFSTAVTVYFYLFRRNVGGNIRDGMQGLGASVIAAPREFAHLFSRSNRFGSADNIAQLAGLYSESTGSLLNAYVWLTREIYCQFCSVSHSILILYRVTERGGENDCDFKCVT